MLVTRQKTLRMAGWVCAPVGECTGWTIAIGGVGGWTRCERS